MILFFLFLCVSLFHLPQFFPFSLRNPTLIWERTLIGILRAFCALLIKFFWILIKLLVYLVAMLQSLFSKVTLVVCVVSLDRLDLYRQRCLNKKIRQIMNKLYIRQTGHEFYRLINRQTNRPPINTTTCPFIVLYILYSAISGNLTIAHAI